MYQTTHHPSFPAAKSLCKLWVMTTNNDTCDLNIGMFLTTMVFGPIIASEVGGWEDGEIEGVGIIWNILRRSRRWRQWTGAKGSKAIHFQTDVRWHGINHGRGGRWARRADLWDRKLSLFAPFLRLTVFETTDEKTNEPILLLGMWCSRRCVHLSKKTIKALAKCDWQMIQILYLAIFFGYTLSVSLV